MIGMLIAAAAPTIAPARAAQPSAACRVIAALFEKEANARPAQPLFKEPSVGMALTRRRDVASFEWAIRKIAPSLEVQTAKADELAARVRVAPNRVWTPNCDWPGLPSGVFYKFDLPVFTKDQRLAVFQREWADRGEICLASRPDRTWNVSCTYTWMR